MGSRTDIKAAGDYLLSVLKVERTVTYSRFYNDRPGSEEALAAGVWPFLERQPVVRRGELDSDDVARLAEEAHVSLEWAGYQLEDLGLVVVTALPGTRLIDGEEDFRIALTQRGEAFIASGAEFQYRDHGSRFNAEKASSWLINFADCNSYAATEFEFSSVASVGASDGEVVATDDCGNVYGKETRPFEWAFQVALWHHYREGNIEPVFETDAQKRAWAGFFARHKFLFGHGEFPAVLWGVSYRLTPAASANPEAVRHAGWFGGE